MLSHSLRWSKNDESTRRLLIPFEEGNLFYRQARTLLFEELKSGHSKIPTVQTLLLLSAQECGAGNRTQAWLYSGMAFRLIEDMGICIDGQLYAGTVPLSDEDIEIRHRLFWSCYFWDKMISLYLGRSPTLQHSTVSPPQIMCWYSLHQLSSFMRALKMFCSGRLGGKRSLDAAWDSILRGACLPTNTSSFHLLFYENVPTV